MLREQQQKDEQLTMCTGVMRSSRNVVHCRSSNNMEEVGGLVQPVWTVCMEEVVECVVSAGVEEGKDKNVTKVLNVL